MPSKRRRSEPVWLTRALIETLHAQQILEHGGRPGLRDEGLLESALARALNARSYDETVDLAGLAAEYGFGLARNHAFFDGNKRIAFVAVNVFLILNGYEVYTDEADVADAVLRLAAGQLTRDEFADWLRAVIVKYVD